MIRPQSFPLGVKFVKDSNMLPKEAVRPAKYGIKISLCQWTTMARRWGRIFGAVAEDINCTPCLAALGLKQLASNADLAQYFLDMGYFDNMEHAEMATKELAPIPAGEIKGIVFFPLEAAPVDPDIILIYGTPAQMARLAAGYVYHHGELIASKTTGFGISCLAAVKPCFTGKPAFVHPGRGERILAGTDEAEMFFTFPARECEALVDGLQKTHERGTRYPVQSYMLYEPPAIKPVRILGEKLTD
ncbi:MAG: DUF169 domain-containing protein [Thermodesulfobacteriota bacterium]